MRKSSQKKNDEELEIIRKLYEQKGIDELTQIFNNYIKDSFIANLKPFNDIDIRNVKDWVLPQKLIIDFYFNPNEKTFKNFDIYAKKYKTIAINNFGSSKEDFLEVKEIYYEIYDKIKKIASKILLFELNKQAAISSFKIFDKSLFNKAIG